MDFRVKCLTVWTITNSHKMVKFILTNTITSSTFQSMTSYKPDFLVSGHLCYSNIWSYRWPATFRRNIPPLRWGQKQDGGTRFMLNIWNHLWLKPQCNPETTIQTSVATKTKTQNLPHIINPSPTKSYHFHNFITLCSWENIVMGIRNFMIITAATMNCLTDLQTKGDSWWHTCWTGQSAAGYQLSQNRLHEETAPWMLEV